MWLTAALSAVGLAATGTTSASAQDTKAAAVGVVERLFGPDRYGTSAAISKDTFATGHTNAYIATGQNFPDALSAGPAASVNAGPVLLVTKNAIPTAIRDELTRLQPSNIVVLGGTGVVSGAVEDALGGYTTGTVRRTMGGDRYETSARISAATFGQGVPVAYVATGANFPDALAAGPGGAPILLVAQNSVPQVIRNELNRLMPASIVVLGGPAVVSDSVKATLGLYTAGSVTRIFGPDRYATAAEFSRSTHAPGVAVAYIATGATYPDALSGGPAGGVVGGPVLLVGQNSIPAVVSTELARLHPGRIVILGGPDVVSESVRAALRAYLPGGGASGAISGTVTDTSAAKAPLKGVYVEASGPSLTSANPSDLSTFTDANGHYQLSNVPAASGGFSILFDGRLATGGDSPRGYQNDCLGDDLCQRTPLTIPPNGTLTANITLGGFGTVSGTVSRTGGSVAGVDVLVCNDTTCTDAMTDSVGAYTTSSAPAGPSTYACAVGWDPTYTVIEAAGCYDNQPDPSTATTFALADEGTVSGIDITLFANPLSATAKAEFGALKQKVDAAKQLQQRMAKALSGQR